VRMRLRRVELAVGQIQGKQRDAGNLAPVPNRPLLGPPRGRSMMPLRPRGRIDVQAKYVYTAGNIA
jgi:hypothetical protein